MIQDFCSVIGQNLDQLKRVEDQNPSLSDEAAEFIRLTNLRLPMNVHGKKNPIRGDLAQLLNSLHTGAPPLPSHNVAVTFMDGFAESNEALRQQYFGHRTSLFSSDFSRFPLERAKHTFEDATDIGITLWENSNKRYLLQKAELSCLKAQLDILRGQYIQASENLRRIQPTLEFFDVRSTVRLNRVQRELSMLTKKDRASPDEIDSLALQVGRIYRLLSIHKAEGGVSNKPPT
ncbi:MAG: hypothetical protein NXH95_10845 [Pseudomonadaceae bacterium]|nr:hypothetical protein [Pseudomonadaceae bacterium]